MENEQVQPSYWNSVFIASAITALVVTIISLIGGYMTIGSEPSGTMFSTMQLTGILSCLIGAMGGLIATWHYAKEHNVTFTIGRGALLGLLVALVATIISVLLGQLWELIDPSYTQAIIDWSIANMEAMPQMPEEARQQAIESMQDINSVSNIAMQALFTFIGLAIMNVISGMIGAKVFASED